MARCSSVKSSGVKISDGCRCSSRNAPPFDLGKATVVVAMNGLLLQQFENSGGALATANTHGDHAVAGIGPLQLAQQSSGELRARASQRVAQSDCSTVSIYLRFL